MGSTSRAIVITNSSTNELKLIERPTPRPRRGEVLVNVRAASLNFRDSEIIRGTYHTRYHLPLVPLSDAVGKVVAVGDGVTRARVGDRVAPTFWRDWIAGDSAAALVGTTLGGPLDGVLAEDVVLEEQRIVHVPRHLSDVEAATLPCAGVTPWHALVTIGNLRPGDTVLIQGTGGVAIFALQFALMMDASPIVMSSSDAKLARAREMGAVHTVNYVETPEWHDQVLDLTNGRGVPSFLRGRGACVR
jgi:NADPH:quinone reductase-like Zn-dependent oxidoreductase